MNKAALLTRIVEALETDMEVLRRAAQTAYETATAEENIAENKYDTLGLEASYLATGQARRTAEIRQALLIYQQLVLRDYDPARGIQIGSLVILEDEAGAQRQVFLGPEAAG
ncbi:transcription elongation factor GreAB, partial [Pseudomonas putida]